MILLKSAVFFFWRKINDKFDNISWSKSSLSSEIIMTKQSRYPKKPITTQSDKLPPPPRFFIRARNSILRPMPEIPEGCARPRKGILLPVLSSLVSSGFADMALWTAYVEWRIGDGGKGRAKWRSTSSFWLVMVLDLYALRKRSAYITDFISLSPRAFLFLKYTYFSRFTVLHFVSVSRCDLLDRSTLAIPVSVVEGFAKWTTE